MKGPPLWRRTPSASVVNLRGVPMATAPWVVSDELWELVEPLLPKRERRFCFPRRQGPPGRAGVAGGLFLVAPGVAGAAVSLSRPQAAAGSAGVAGDLVRAAHGDRVAAPADRARLRLRRHLLATAGRVAAGRGVGRAARAAACAFAGGG